MGYNQTKTTTTRLLLICDEVLGNNEIGVSVGFDEIDCHIVGFLDQN
jgi:hypothetical protein